MRVIYYHGDCPDGFGAAWAAWLRFGDEKTVYVPAGYGNFDPSQGITSLDDVFCIDYVPHEPFASQLQRQAGALTVLDHHITAATVCKTLAAAGATVVHDCTRSGAGIAWDYFHPDVPRSWLINYIEDRDIWRWKLPHAREICYGIDLIPKDFAAFSAADTAGADHARFQGEPVMRYAASLVQSACSRARVRHIFGYSNVPVVNSSLLQSDIGNALLEEYPKAPFSAVWYERSLGVQYYSLRSSDDRADVGALAVKFGGGGHRNAAGITVSEHDDT